MGAQDVSCEPLATVPDGYQGIGADNFALGIGGALAVLAAGIVILVVALRNALGTAVVAPQTLALAASALVAGCLAAIYVLMKARDYLFKGKLACIDGDRCAIGRVARIEKNREDTDLLLNLVLAPADEKTDLAAYLTFPQVLSLILNDPGVATRGWVFRPLQAGDGFGPNRLPILHCEIEGSLYDWLLAFIAYLWILVALGLAAIALATVYTALMATVIGAAIAILLFLLLWFVITPLFGLFTGSTLEIPSADLGPIDSATPGPDGAIHVDASGDTIHVDDYVAIDGQHVTDTGHHTGGCWNELHAVKAVAKVTADVYTGVTDGIHPPRNDLADRYCAALTAFVAGEGTAGSGAIEHPTIV